DRPISRQARQQVERFGTGQKHRVAQMAAGLRVGENMREENTVVYFKALLLLEGPRPLRRHDLGARRQPGHELCGLRNELVATEELAPARGQPAVELLDMDVQKTLAQVPLGTVEERTGRGAVQVACGPCWKVGTEPLAQIPEVRRSRTVETEIVAQLGMSDAPRGRVTRGKAGPLQYGSLMGRAVDCLIHRCHCPHGYQLGC